MTDTFRALCAELNLIWGRSTNPDDLFENMIPLVSRARALLDQPVAGGLTQQGGGDEPLIGDYVLATKWSDGDPCDHFCVGFFSGKDRDRYKVVDADGNLFRANGFRRCETITQEEGELILSLKIGDQTGPSVWWHLKKIRGIEAQSEAKGPTDEEIISQADKFLAYSDAHMGDPARWEGSDVDLVAFTRHALARWGRPAPVPVAIPGEKYHEDMGPVTWWRLPVDEPPWVGTPNDSDWPGYHTHFTPAPTNPLNANALPTPDATND